FVQMLIVEKASRPHGSHFLDVAFHSFSIFETQLTWWRMVNKPFHGAKFRSVCEQASELVGVRAIPTRWKADSHPPSKLHDPRQNLLALECNLRRGQNDGQCEICFHFVNCFRSPETKSFAQIIHE